MNAEPQAKLERYFRNSKDFLWSLGPRDDFGPLNQEQNYEWLASKGFPVSKGSTYDRAKAELLQNLGIEKILVDLIVPQVKARFTDDALAYLRDFWRYGTRPDFALLKNKYNLDNPSPFLEISTRWWGEFAGLWFEEIEEKYRGFHTP